MKSRILPIALGLIVAGCSASPAKQDKENVGKARSLLAESAFLTESHQSGRLTGTYYREMREAAETELAAVAETAPRTGSAAGRAVAELAPVRGDPPARLLRGRAAAAERIENGLEAD